MILVMCVDDEYGLQFHHRRQSRDRVLTADLLAIAGNLWIHPYSAKLFPGDAAVKADENYLALAGPGQWCFAEDREYLNYADKIEKIVLYHWNRVYPRDLTFEFPGQWRLAETRDFAGSSHEKITREVYVP